MNDFAEPKAGFYRHTLVRGGPPAGVRIWFGPPRDPDTGELMDRSWRWQADVNGTYVELDRVWPQCLREPIAEAEYDFFCAAHRHALAHDPYNPVASPRRRVDWDTATPPSF